MEPPSSKTILLVVLAATVMVATFGFYAFFAREVTHWMEGKHHWFHDYEPWSLFGFVATFIFATALFLPAQPFVVATGYLFGFHFLTVLFLFAVYFLAAFLMFNGARFWFRPMVETWLSEHKLVNGMTHYVQDPKEGAKMNLLFSFTPIAFCLHCYVMGITEINEHIFLFTFIMGQSPHIFFGLLTGSALLAAETSNLSMDWMKIGMLGLGVLGTFCAVVYLGTVAQDILRQMEEGGGKESLLAAHKEESARGGVGITFEEADDMSVVVQSLTPGGPADVCGVIRVGDVLHEVDGQKVHRAQLELITEIVPGRAGTAVQLGFKRAGSIASDPVYQVLLHRKKASKTYGTAETQTPPATPDKECQTMTYGHPDVVVHGGSTPISEIHNPAGEVRPNSGSGPMLVTVGTGA